MAKLAIVYYSAYGHTYELARSLEQGAKSFGADTRLRKVHELVSDEVIAKQKTWLDHRAATREVPEATVEDLAWADGFAFGTPTRFGGPAAQLKEFIDRTGALWQKGGLANKAVTSFSGSMNPHGGQETTILALSNVFYHWGAIIVPLGYTDPVVSAAGGNPYGTSYTANDEALPDAVLKAAFYQGTRLARVADALRNLRA